MSITLETDPRSDYIVFVWEGWADQQRSNRAISINQGRKSETHKYHKHICLFSPAYLLAV